MAIKLSDLREIPNAAYPTPGRGLVLGLDGQLPLAVRQLLPGYEYAYAENPSALLITGTTEGTATTVITAPSFTADGTTAVWVEFWCPFIDTPLSADAWIKLVLFDGSTALGQSFNQRDESAIANSANAPGSLRRKYTPAAGTSTLSVKAFVNTLSGTIGAGSGTSGAYAPAHLRVTRA